jgi:hypothetical protein
MFPVLPLFLSAGAVFGLGVTGAKFHLKSNVSNSETLDPSLKQALANSDSSGTRRQLLEMSRSPVF